MNPRRITECVASLRHAPMDTAYIRGMNLPQATEAINAIIAGNLDRYDRFILTSDDVIVTGPALDAVAELSRQNPDKVTTGYCNLDAESPLVNITSTPIRGDVPTVEGYDFYRLDELPLRGPIPTGFTGMALTCLPAGIAAMMLPLGCYFNPAGTGYSSDFHLSRRVLDAGIEIVAAAEGFVYHVKETWNQTDVDPRKRLHLGNPEIVWQHQTDKGGTG